MSLLEIIRITQIDGSNKGGITQGQAIADPWAINTRTEDNSRYTSNAVVETVATGTFTPAWTPVVKGVFYNESDSAYYDLKLTADDGTVTYANLSADDTYTVTAAGKVAYMYDNVVIPANDLPTINVKFESIPLIAKARRISVYYSQIAANLIGSLIRNN